jgi:hypothetical protein
MRPNPRTINVAMAGRAGREMSFHRLVTVNRHKAQGVMVRQKAVQ